MKQFSPKHFTLLFIKYILERSQKTQADSNLSEYDIQRVSGELWFLLIFSVDFAIYDYLGGKSEGDAIREAFYNSRLGLAKQATDPAEAKNIIDTQENRIACYSAVMQKAEPEKYQEAIGKEFAKLSGYKKDAIIWMYGTIEFIGMMEFVQETLHAFFETR